MFRVVDLIDHPQHVPAISAWMWESWDRHRGWTLEDSVVESKRWCRRDGVPWGILALENDNPIGCMALVPQDLDERPDLGPWLAAQYVTPDYRGAGVAKAMAAALEERARRLNISRVYMWTEHNEKIYLRLGWSKLFATRTWGYLDVTVFCKELRGDIPNHR